MLKKISEFSNPKWMEIILIAPQRHAVNISEGTWKKKRFWGILTDVLKPTLDQVNKQSPPPSQSDQVNNPPPSDNISYL